MPLAVLGGMVYRFPDEVNDVRLNGVSVLGLNVEEAFVGPDGWGYVLVRKKLGEADKPVKRWLCGQVRNYTYRGQVQVT